jgi:hypothetical protein
VGYGATPHATPRAFWEVWNLFSIEKGSKNFKIDFGKSLKSYKNLTIQ